MGERLDVEGGVYGERPDQSTPIRNKADAAWEQLESLRAQARSYGLAVDDAWPLARVQQEIDAFVARLPKHEADCALVTTHHLTCTCGAYRRSSEATS